MGRAELRRQAKSRKKEQEKISKVLKNAGFPEFQLPPAPLKTTNLSTQEVANVTGTKIAVLEQWRKRNRQKRSEKPASWKHRKNWIRLKILLLSAISSHP